MDIIKPSIFVQFKEDSTFLKYVQDIVNEFVMNKQKPLLITYEEIENYQQVLDSQQFLSDLGNVIIDNTINSAKNLRKLIQKCDLGITDGRVNILAEILFYNLQAIQKESIHRQIALGRLILIDFNWNVNVCLSADNLARTQVSLVLLQLILKKYGTERETRVNLEFTKEELENFLTRLNKIKATISNVQPNH